MLYAGNNAGPDSPCTPAVYHACQAYGTAPSPFGPWTWRGGLLGPVSSTTSHAGAVEFKGDRKSVVKGKGVSVRVDRGGGSIIETREQIKCVTSRIPNQK